MLTLLLRELGVHERGSSPWEYSHIPGAGRPDAQPVEVWQQSWEVDRLPRDLVRIDLQLEIIPDFLFMATQLGEKHEKVKQKLANISVNLCCYFL